MFAPTAMTVRTKMATTIYCSCRTAQQIFMKLLTASILRQSSASQVCNNKVSKSSSQQQPPSANVFQLAKNSTNTSFRQQQLRYTTDNPPSPHLLICFPRSPPKALFLSASKSTRSKKWYPVFESVIKKVAWFLSLKGSLTLRK